MLVIKVVIHKGQSEVCGGALITRKPLIINTAKTQRSTKKQGRLVKAGQRFVFSFESPAFMERPFLVLCRMQLRLIVSLLLQRAILRLTTLILS